MTMLAARARAVRVLAHAGVLRPQRPSRLLGVAGAVLGWGTSTAAIAMSAAARFPAERGLVDDLGSLTYAEIDARTNAMARGLSAIGVGEGDAVAVLCRNHRYIVEVSIAVSKLGADVVYLNTGFAPRQLEAVIDAMSPAVVVHDAEFADSLVTVGSQPRMLVAWTEHDRGETCESLATSYPSDKLASPMRRGRSTILTSGTSGEARAASRGPAGVDAAAVLLSAMPLQAGGVTHIAAPLFHTWGWAHFQLGMLLGSALVLTRRFDPERCLRLVAEERCDALVVVPIMLHRMLAQLAAWPALDTRDMSCLRVVASSGSALPDDLAVRWMDAFGDHLFNVYGSTEVAWATFATPADLRDAPSTAGRAPLGTEVRIFDDDDRPCGVGETGRIFVRNSMLFEGYAGGGSKALIDDLMATGDVGHLDESGLLFVEGRADDMVISGGENVYPEEVEAALLAHPAVADAGVIGIADPELGQRLRALVVCEPGADVGADDLREFAKTRLANFKVPREIVFVEKLPRNATGKIVRRELASYDRGDDTAPPRT
jgi:acyl-CoA synthetase (AMP-forming)/AMP-acid ligase II